MLQKPNKFLLRLPFSLLVIIHLWLAFRTIIRILITHYTICKWFHRSKQKHYFRCSSQKENQILWKPPGHTQKSMNCFASYDLHTKYLSRETFPFKEKPQIIIIWCCVFKMTESLEDIGAEVLLCVKGELVFLCESIKNCSPSKRAVQRRPVY